MRLSNRMTARDAAQFIDRMERHFQLTHELSREEFLELSGFHMEHYAEIMSKLCDEELQNPRPTDTSASAMVRAVRRFREQFPDYGLLAAKELAERFI